MIWTSTSMLGHRGPNPCSIRHGIVSHASCAIGRGRTRRWRRSIENWPPDWTTKTIQCPIIRSERSITGALCCAAWVRPRLSTGFCPPSIRQDLEAGMPVLKACRQLLIVVPASLEEHPLIVTLVRDGDTLPRLRRLHHAFGEALREEQASREIDSLDT